MSYALTSLEAAEASPDQLAALVPNHWHIDTMPSMRSLVSDPYANDCPTH